MSLAGTLAAASLAAAVFALATAGAVWLAWPWLPKAFARLPPAARARACLAVAAAPSAIPALLLALCFAPGLLGWLGLHPDHCTAHAGHPHLCLVHPSVPLDLALSAVLLCVVVSAAAALVWVARRLIASRRSAERLRLGGALDLSSGVRRVESERPFSFATGLLGSEIFVSGALADALPPALLDAVVAHERAHLRRRDGLWRLLARILSMPHLPRLRRELLARLELAGEQACDEEAARQGGDRLRVAEAILAVERLLRVAPPAPSEPLQAFGGSSVAPRVQALLADPLPGPSRARVTLAAIAFGVVAALLAEPLHHVTEHGLERLLALL